jgi:DNA-binding response OmpR family regulator
MTENKKKILVVDDDDSLNTILVDKLNISGFEAKGAVDGEDGFNKAIELHPDVILLDLVMPKMNGMEMLKKLRTDEWGKTAKVVILTLLDKVDYVAEAMEYHVAGYIVKTDYSLEGIVKKIEEVSK